MPKQLDFVSVGGKRENVLGISEERVFVVADFDGAAAILTGEKAISTGMLS